MEMTILIKKNHSSLSVCLNSNISVLLETSESQQEFENYKWVNDGSFC